MTNFAIFHRLSKNRKVNNFSLQGTIVELELGSTLCNILLQLATLKFVAWKVEHAVVIRATTLSTCNATMLRHKLNENVARSTWPLENGEQHMPMRPKLYT